MSDSTANLDQVSSTAILRETTINALLDAASPATIFGRRASTCSLLDFGYYGGRINGTSVANGVKSATASNTNYVVVHRGTLAVSISTSNTNWNDTTTYGRAYLLTAGASSITAYEDHRLGTGGILTPLTGFTGGTLTSALNEAPIVTLASAGTVAIGAAAANTISISGTTTITAFDTIASGAVRRLIFEGALTFTHNAISLILPTGANITTAAGDTAEVVSLGSGNWRCTDYMRNSGAALAPATFTGGTLTGALNEAPITTLASATTTNIGAEIANTISISGTTTITGFDTIAAGAVRRLVFQGALTLTHNGASLILPTAANIVTAAGDVAEFVSLGSGNWRCFNYMKAGGYPVRDQKVVQVAVGDETTAITTGTAKVTFRMPFAMTLTAVRASLTTVSSSGNPAIDINEAGASIFSTTLTIDASEKTSTTAATPAVISDPALADDAEMTVDIDTAGTGAAGLKIALIGY